MTGVGEAEGPFGGSSHSSASAEDVWAVWTNPAEWPGDVIVMAKIDGPFAVGAKITMRVKGHPPLRLTVGGHGKLPSDGHVTARWRS